MRKRPIQLLVMVNEQEKSKLDELCRKTGLGYGALIRKFIMGKEIKERPNVDFIDLRQSIDHIGININQIAHWANANGGITPEQFEEARKLLAEVKWIIKGWAKKWL